MSGNRILLDTNIILYLLKGDDTLVEVLNKKQIYISFITQLELYSFKDLNHSEESKINELLDSFSIIGINDNIKSFTIETRKNYNIKLPDSIIVSTAMYLKIPFMSADKVFEKVDNLNFINYDLHN